jgi:NADP-dependent 3-hydroxy acid dehydrogenase YdfG
MNALKNRIALVTGASAGIGEAVARGLAAEGADLILAARRRDRLDALAAELRDRTGVRTLTVALDVRDRAAVARVADSLDPGWRAVDILVNNAGLSRGLDPVQSGSIDDWEEMIDTNVKGVLYVSRAFLPGMVERQRGHVVLLGSIAGREVYPGGNVYCATKAAVEILTRALRVDLVGKGIRVTTVDPGMVETEFSLVRFHGDAARAGQVYRGITPLTAADVADAVLYAVTRPPHMNVQSMILMATNQASATVAHREG